MQNDLSRALAKAAEFELLRNASKVFGGSLSAAKDFRNYCSDTELPQIVRELVAEVERLRNQIEIAALERLARE